jgi:glycosyltransferase involved in cell wall biosynthesis
MKLTFVLPRYGRAIVGGAETAARLLASHLAARDGWEVEVLTTCAEDFVTWADVYPAGEEVIDGVSVVRFASERGRDPSFHPFSASLLSAPDQVTLADAEQWIDLQGPVVPELVDAARSSGADALVFYPYLYYPTVRVIDRVQRPTILHPAAHDEPALRLPVFPPVFAAADGLVFQTEAERDLVQGLFPVASHRQLLLGLGVDDPDRRDPATAVSPGTDDDPYLLCLGRVEPKKGTSLLASLFARYKERRAGPLRLVMAGPIVDAPGEHPDVDLVGSVSDDEKWALLEGAVALVAPSPWEAFSLVVAESWSARTPVMVNAQCAATVEHCRRSGGGVLFGDYREFEVGVDLLSTDPGARRSLGERGRAYVDRRFRWPHVIDRYSAFVERVVAAG